MKKPDYTWGDKVEFLFNGNGEPLEGFIEIVDSNGTFEQREQPSYDICVPAKNNCIYKHVPESDIRRKLINEPITRGVLQYHTSEEIYSVLYSRAGYAALLDNPVFTEIRVTGTEEWIPVSLANLKEMVEKSVEIRYMPPYMLVCNLIHTHQDDNDMIYEVYREEANVVLHDGGWVAWNPEDLILRGAKHHISAEYYYERVYRWDVESGIMRICLGRVADPKKNTVENAEQYIKILEDKNKRIPDVPPENIRVVERLRIEEYEKSGLKRMISYASYIGRTSDAEILTPVTKDGFDYQRENERHQVYYKPGWIEDAII